MIVLGIILTVVVYLLVGGAIATWRLPRNWRVSRKVYTYEEIVRTTVKEQSAWLVFTWPVLLPVTLIIDWWTEHKRTINFSFDSFIDSYDPERIRNVKHD